LAIAAIIALGICVVNTTACIGYTIAFKVTSTNSVAAIQFRCLGRLASGDALPPRTAGQVSLASVFAVNFASFFGFDVVDFAAVFVKKAAGNTLPTRAAGKTSLARVVLAAYFIVKATRLAYTQGRTGKSSPTRIAVAAYLSVGLVAEHCAAAWFAPSSSKTSQPCVAYY